MVEEEVTGWLLHCNIFLYEWKPWTRSACSENVMNTVKEKLTGSNVKILGTSTTEHFYVFIPTCPEGLPDRKVLPCSPKVVSIYLASLLKVI